MLCIFIVCITYVIALGQPASCQTLLCPSLNKEVTYLFTYIYSCGTAMTSLPKSALKPSAAPPRDLGLARPCAFRLSSPLSLALPNHVDKEFSRSFFVFVSVVLFCLTAPVNKTIESMKQF